MSGDDIQTKIQKLELETIRAVTELQKDVQVLTREVTKLTSQIQKMTENYVTVTKHNENIMEIRSDLRSAKKVGMIRSILTGLLATIITAIVTFEVMRITR